MQVMFNVLSRITNVDTIKRAEDLGFSHFGAGEGPLLFSDPYQTLALGAAQTSSIQLGPLVTNPVTRIPPQTANSIATLNALAPGRTFLGIGTANNALRSLGAPIATQHELEDSIRVIKGLLSGDRVPYTFRGGTRSAEFLAPESGWYNINSPIPLYIAVGGPKGLELAARYADYVVYCLGPGEELIRLVRRTIDERAEAYGRDPQEIKLVALTWWHQLSRGEGFEDAVADLGAGPGSSAATNIKFMEQHSKELEPSFVRTVRNLANFYLQTPADAPEDYHLDLWRSYMQGYLPPAAKELTAREIVDYFCLWGTQEECAEKADKMRRAGADVISIFVTNPASVERAAGEISSALIE